jgi:leucine dehydrogenase
METDYVSGLAGRSGDPSPVTAHGVFRAIQAAAKERWGSDDISSRVIALQGCGHVGYYLAKELHEAGAKLVVTDIDADRVKRVVNEFGARPVGTDEIYTAQADVFAPCALGAIINDRTIPQLKVQIVAGAANNQLLEERHGEELEDRDILYAPDYVANAGGVINVYSELAGWTSARSFRKADEIYDTVLRVFAIAKEEKIPTYLAADRLAEQRIHAVGSMVRTWPQWPNK